MNKLLMVLTLIGMSGCVKQESDVYLFSFFQGNGEDGLHLATSTDGITWSELNHNQTFLRPAVGEDNLMRDPCIIQGHDDKFHMVWTTGWNEKGIGYANSTDLINWSEQRYIPVMQHEPDARNCWAPELFFDHKSKQYVIYWATTIPGKFPDTDSLGDDGYNHRMYYTTTKDFIDFSATELLYDDGFNVIDATILQTDQSYLMFLKDETLNPIPEKNIKISRSDTLFDRWGHASEAITKNWVEGPSVIKIDNQWIVYFDMYTEQKMGAVSSTDLINWVDISDKMNFPDGIRHGTIFRVKERILRKIISTHENRS